MNTINEKIKTVSEIKTDATNACVEFWEPIGILDGIENEDIKKKVAQEVTKMAKYLFYTDGAYMDAITICVFPTVRKIFASGKQVNKNYSPKILCDQLQDTIKQVANAEAEADFGIDIEAQACSSVADFFIQDNEL